MNPFQDELDKLQVIEIAVFYAEAMGKWVVRPFYGVGVRIADILYDHEPTDAELLAPYDYPITITRGYRVAPTAIEIASGLRNRRA